MIIDHTISSDACLCVYAFEHDTVDQGSFCLFVCNMKRSTSKTNNDLYSLYKRTLIALKQIYPLHSNYIFNNQHIEHIIIK